MSEFFGRTKLLFLFLGCAKFQIGEILSEDISK